VFHFIATLYKKKELYGTSKKGSADDKKLANMFKVSKKE
jgi:hypothetical protein